ncbi:MAG: peptidylprolyl isomerase [Candidatus Zixiibacteriota bacterium]|nr:MAG: peptidylprolyl isomerase [candidate division Zixibacteria bacterium]
MKKTSLLVLTGILVCALLSGCATKEEGQIVAKVGDRTITVDEMEAEWQKASRLRIKGVPDLQRKKEVVEKMIGEQVVILEAYKEGLDNAVEGDTNFAQQKERILLNLLYQKEVVDKSQPTESEIKKEYQMMQNEVHAWHILVENKEQADEVYQMLKDGADFAELAKERSIDPTAKDNAGDLGFFRWGKMVPEFQEVAFKMKEGELSRPVKTTYGYHVIKFIERREVEQQSYEETKKLIMPKLNQAKRESRVKEYFAQLRKRVGFKINQDALELVMSKKQEVPPDSLSLRRPADVLDLETFTPQENAMTLFSYDKGEVTVEKFAQDFNQIPQPYRPKLSDRDKITEIAFQSLVRDLLMDVAQKENLEESDDFKKDWKGIMEKEMAARMKNEVILKGVGISDDELKSYYDRHKDRFTVQAKVKIREILLKTEEEARDVLRQVRRGTDFAKLAQEKTIRTSAKDSGGDLGEFTRPRYPELFDAAVKLSQGKVDGPIKIQDRQFGESYAVVKLISKTEETLQSLEEVKDRLTRMARQEKDNNIYNNWIENNKTRYKVEVFDQVIESTIQEEEAPPEQG